VSLEDRRELETDIPISSKITRNQNQICRVNGECVSYLASVRDLNQGSNPCTFPNSRTKDLVDKRDGVGVGAYPFYFICRC
jgi:hypothetical protein